MGKIDFMMDVQTYTTKQQALDDIQNITWRIANYKKYTSGYIKDIAEQTGANGHTFYPAMFKYGERSNANWKYQQLFGIDFDKGITYQQAMDIAVKYNIVPAYAYATLSCNLPEIDKFRFVYQTPFVIDSKQMRDAIQLTLMYIFNNSDPSCKDAARLFFGGKKLIHTDYDQYLWPHELFLAYQLMMEEYEKNSLARNIKSFAESTGLVLDGNMLKIKVYTDDAKNQAQTMDNIELEGNPQSAEKPRQYIYIYTNQIIPQLNNLGKPYNIYVCKYSNQKSEQVEIFLSDRGRRTAVKIHAHGAKYKVDNFDVTTDDTKIPTIKDWDWQATADNCQLWREFEQNNYWLYQNNFFLLVSNLARIEGGMKKLGAVLQQQHTDTNGMYYGDGKISKWKTQAKYIRKNYENPQNCTADNCPFFDDCANCCGNIIKTVKTNKGEFNVVLQQQPELQTLEQAREKLSTVFSNIIAEPDTNLHVIKSPTGSGKTELLLDMDNITIAVPTHRLKNEIAKRFADKGKTVHIAPDWPKLTGDLKKEIDALYIAGCHSQASKILRAKAKDKKDPDYLNIKKYLDQKDRIGRKKGIIITTHAAVLYNHGANDTIVFDEDIIPTLMPQKKISFEDVLKVKAYINDDLFAAVDIADKKIINSVLNDLINNTAGIVYDTQPVFIKNDTLIQISQLNRVGGDLIHLFQSKKWIKEKENNTIHYASRISLPPAKKIVIMSATADPVISELVFGKSHKFHGVGEVKHQGNIIQYPQFTCSRQFFFESSNEKKIEYIKDIIKDLPVITHKAAKSKFNENQVIANFGGCAGINQYEGQDIAVAGTPHISPYTYILFAALLDQKVYGIDDSIAYRQIQKNGYKFYFSTYDHDNSTLQAIQLYLIEQELLQAIGRARTISNDCKVIVFSNYPVPQAQIINLSKEEIKQLTVRKQKSQRRMGESNICGVAVE